MLNLQGGNSGSGYVNIPDYAHIHVLDSEEVDTEALDVGGNISVAGNISAGGETGKTESVPVTMADGSQQTLKFKRGLYVARD